MKIITPRGNKDYYDYLVGLFGEDEKVVYDRRQYHVLCASESIAFNTNKLSQDKKKQKMMVYEWQSRHCRRVERIVGRRFCCLLEVGTVHYYLLFERYLSDKDVVMLDWTLLEKRDNQNHYGATPMSFFVGEEVGYYHSHSPRDRFNFKNADVISNPILKGTFMASSIPGEEIFKALYAYLSSLNDKDIVDNRTDVQKAESAGFDRKTSFRNVK